MLLFIDTLLKRPLIIRGDHKKTDALNKLVFLLLFTEEYGHHTLHNIFYMYTEINVFFYYVTQRKIIVYASLFRFNSSVSFCVHIVCIFQRYLYGLRFRYNMFISIT